MEASVAGLFERNPPFQAVGGARRSGWGPDDWITAKAASYGIADVAIDGTDRGTVNLYAHAQQWNTIITCTGLPAGQHTIQFLPTGTHDSRSSGNTIVLDALPSTEAAKSQRVRVRPPRHLRAASGSP
jgi:hypothetical protein